MQTFILLFVKLILCVWILYCFNLPRFFVECKSFILLTINYINMWTYKKCCLELLWKNMGKLAKQLQIDVRNLSEMKKDEKWASFWRYPMWYSITVRDVILYIIYYCYRRQVRRVLFIICTAFAGVSFRRKNISKLRHPPLWHLHWDSFFNETVKYKLNKLLRLLTMGMWNN